MAVLENGKYCVVFPSGMAAVAAVCSMLKVGDEILCIKDPYIGTFKFLNTLRNVTVNFADLSIPEIIHKSVKPNTKVSRLV